MNASMNTKYFIRFFAGIKEHMHALLWFMRHITRKYNITEISIINQFVQDTDTCFDVGAHAGFWTRPLSQLVTRGRVYAFEALPYYAHVLTIVIQLLRLQNVTVVDKAVSDKSGVIAIAWRGVNGKHLTGCTHIATVSDNPDHIITNAITLDSLLPVISTGSRVSFVKIDIEGAELMAVRGAVASIDKFRPVFYLEVVSDYCKRYGYTPEDLFRFFADLNYMAYEISSSGVESRAKWIDEITYAGAGNVLFVPSEHVFCQ